MTHAEQVLIISAVALLAGGVATGVAMGIVRGSEPEVPKYLRFAHLGAYMQAPLLFGVAVALQFSEMAPAFDTATAALVSAGALLLVVKDLANWRLHVADEFRERGVGYALGAGSGVLQLVGLVLLAVAVASGV